MGKDNKRTLLSRLRTAVKKVKILLNLSVNLWRLASTMGTASGTRRLSFNDRPGLRAITDEVVDSASSPEDSSRGSPSLIRRTTSYPSEDDIDKRAEMFIANFRRQLQIERQISLELKYLRGNSFKSVSP